MVLKNILAFLPGADGGDDGMAVLEEEVDDVDGDEASERVT